MGDVILQARQLTQTFFRKGRESARHFDAVHDFSLALEGGQLVALMGKSGSGKTTVLNMLAGLLAPTQGQVLLGGVDMYALSDEELSRMRNASIGVVPQGQTPLHAFSVVENVVLPYTFYRERGTIEQRALELLGRLGIADLADSYPSELSGGELRRMAVARALICQPRVVLADEPTADLDEENTRLVLEALREAAQAGCAVLLATHDPAAEAFADSVMLL